MKILVSDHAISRFKERATLLTRKKASKEIIKIIKNNKIEQYFSSTAMTCKSKELGIVIILTTNADGDLVVKTILTEEQFNEQENKLLRQYKERNSTSSHIDVNAIIAMCDSDALNVRSLVKVT